MRVTSIKANLNRLKTVFRNIWEDGAEDVIDNAIAELENSKRRFDNQQGKTHHPGLVPEPWGYRIYPESPLRFRRSTALKGLSCWLDLYCTVLWRDEQDLPVQQDITLRLWSSELSSVCREEWDSERIIDHLTSPFGGSRVMSRWHFDLANAGQNGPKYHLQFGGNAKPDELCWFPEIISLPRIMHQPVDLILICQMVAANFYIEDYSQLHDTPEWTHIVRESQWHLLLDYYKDCVNAVEQGCSLLDVLWNSGW